MLRFIHYAAEPFRPPLRSQEQEPIDRNLTNKPKGLWFSVEGEDDWPSWCKAEGFRLNRLTYAHYIRLQPDARIMHLSSAADIDLFTERYGKYNRLLAVYEKGREIAWSLVADEYQGIVIAPYVWSRRLCYGANWYYSWDCASGCVWDASAVAGVSLMQN